MCIFIIHTKNLGIEFRRSATWQIAISVYKEDSSRNKAGGTKTSVADPDRNSLNWLVTDPANPSRKQAKNSLI